MFVRVCCVRVCCVVHTKGQRSRNEGSRFLYRCALNAGRTALIGRYFNRWLAPPSNVPGSQLGEMALDRRPRDETRRTCFLLRSTISLTNRRAVGTASLKEMLRNEGTRLLYRQRCDITQRSVLLRCDWSSYIRSNWSSDTRAASL